MVYQPVVFATRIEIELSQHRERHHRPRERADRRKDQASEAVNEVLTFFDGRFSEIPHMAYMGKQVLRRALEFHRGFLEDDQDDPYVRVDAASALEKMSEIHRKLGEPR